MDDDTFRFPRRAYDALNELDSDERGALCDAICAYCFGGYNMDNIKQMLSELESYEVTIFKLIAPMLDDWNFVDRT